MTGSESLAYKMQPAGHEEPEQKRYAKPDTRLSLAFDTWLNKQKFNLSRDPMHSRYIQACRLVKGLDVSQEAIYGLLFQYQDHPQVAKQGPMVRRQSDPIGNFVSAVHNRLPDKEIIFDLDLPIAPISSLGYRLPKSKRLINFSEIGDGLGDHAFGVVINCGTCLDMNYRSSGVALNYGRTEGVACVNAPGIAINFGTPFFTTNQKALGPLLNFGDESGRGEPRILMPKDEAAILIGWYADIAVRVPNSNVQKNRETPMDTELINYIDRFYNKFVKGRSDYHLVLDAIEELGPEPGTKIQKDLEAHLRRHGYSV